MNSTAIEFVGVDSGERYTVEARLGQGAQGSVLKVRADSDGKTYAVKWYHASSATQQQRTQLETLIERGAPVCNALGVKFIWPIEMVRYPASASYGYLMPLYDNTRYVHYNKVVNGQVEQPRRDVLARMSYRLCMAIEAVHRAGLAYCDINLGNIQFDVENGSLVVCDNDNVVVNNAVAAVAGMAEFMAPEVATGEAHPNAQSDLYSAAVLLYQLWMYEHPMEGALTEQVRCWDQPAQLKHFALEPLFAHHPDDPRNSPRNEPCYEYSVRRWDNICTMELKRLFTSAFTEGVNHPARRVRLSHWQRCFMDIEASAILCPACSAINILQADSPQTCSHCGAQHNASLRLDIKHLAGASTLVVHSGARLRQHHMTSQASGEQALALLGQVEDHPNKPGAYILRNQSENVWFYSVGNEHYRIEPGQARPLVEGGHLTIGEKTLEIAAA